MRSLEDKGRTCHFLFSWFPAERPEETTLHHVAWKSKGKTTVPWAHRSLKFAPTLVPFRRITPVSTPVGRRMMNELTYLVLQWKRGYGTAMLSLSLPTNYARTTIYHHIPSMSKVHRVLTSCEFLAFSGDICSFFCTTMSSTDSEIILINTSFLSIQGNECSIVSSGKRMWRRKKERIHQQGNQERSPGSWDAKHCVFPRLQQKMSHPSTITFGNYRIICSDPIYRQVCVP